MEKHENGGFWTEETLRRYLRQAAESEPVPERLKPEQMEAWLRQHMEAENRAEEQEEKRIEAEKWTEEQERTEEAEGSDSGIGEIPEGERMKEERREKGKKKPSYRRWWYGTAAAAACLTIVLFAAGRSVDWEQGDLLKQAGKTVQEETEQKNLEYGMESAEEKKDGGTTYEELYQAFSDVWKEQRDIEISEGGLAKRGDFDVAYMEESKEETSGENAAADSSVQSGKQSEEQAADYGRTNQQEEEVEEADIIKNDGRYLYQAVHLKRNQKYAVQIADTKDGLKEASTIGQFENEISNIYVWKDMLAVIETGYAKETAEEEESGEDNLLETIKDFIENIFSLGEEPVYRETAYSRVHIYDIKDRTKPTEYHTFTIKGSYRDSRISDGYLYFFTSCDAYKPRLEKEYRAYLPEVDGKILSPDKIYLPEETDTASYLVMTSIHMEQPDEFTDTAAIVTSADKFYVSQSNIYVTDSRHINYGAKGRQTGSTRIIRFSYQDGKMKREAEGTVQGILRDDMAMNEHRGYLRMVTTVESQNREEITDDVTGDVIGYDSMDSMTSNSLYVLDEKLKVVGEIGHIAEDELIYSARFMGDTGYFVTFRQTDPLFSVDLSNPRKPKILGELKISGFSEYLHFYAENLLLGIGMEADEDTGRTEGIKLSMFDVSNPSDVKEQYKLNLSDYDYAEALYNYKAVLIDTNKNLFGFYAEGYGEEYQCSYLLFSFENGKFREILNIDCVENDMSLEQVRGTYIGDCFYLLCRDGRIEAYSLKDGSKQGELALQEQ